MAICKRPWSFANLSSIASLLPLAGASTTFAMLGFLYSSIFWVSFVWFVRVIVVFGFFSSSVLCSLAREFGFWNVVGCYRSLDLSYIDGLTPDVFRGPDKFGRVPEAFFPCSEDGPFLTPLFSLFSILVGL